APAPAARPRRSAPSRRPPRRSVMSTGRASPRAVRAQRPRASATMGATRARILSAATRPGGELKPLVTRGRSGTGELGMPRIAWVEDVDATGELARIFAAARTSLGGDLHSILRTLSFRPDFLAAFLEMYMAMIRSPGALSHAQRQMVATYVAALNRCRYCRNNHTR